MLPIQLAITFKKVTPMHLNQNRNLNRMAKLTQNPSPNPNIQMIYVAFAKNMVIYQIMHVKIVHIHIMISVLIKNLEIKGSQIVQI